MQYLNRIADALEGIKFQMMYYNQEKAAQNRANQAPQTEFPNDTPVKLPNALHEPAPIAPYTIPSLKPEEWFADEPGNYNG